MPKPQRRRVSPGKPLSAGEQAQHLAAQATERQRRGYTSFSRPAHGAAVTRAARAEKERQKSATFGAQVGESRLSQGVRSRQTRNQVRGFGRATRNQD